jgi:hypothetical protein
MTFETAVGSANTRCGIGNVVAWTLSASNVISGAFAVTARLMTSDA